MEKNNIVLELRNISKSFVVGDNEILTILDDINISIKKGESVSLVGQSGSGKSTLLHIAALLDNPSSGDIFIGGSRVERENDRLKTEIRRKNIGFVYQFHNLLQEFSALENVMIPQMINSNISRKEIVERSKELLNIVGLSNRTYYSPKKMSGGEQQRVAIARALSNDPDIIIADEPTGNLDDKTSYVIFDLMMNLTLTRGMAILMATHNHELSNKFKRQINLKNGQIHES